MSEPCSECGCRGCILIRHPNEIEVTCSGCGATRLAAPNEHLVEVSHD